MIITYLRSSSYGTHSMCEQQYFIEYVLGLKSPSNKKLVLSNTPLLTTILIKNERSTILSEYISELT